MCGSHDLCGTVTGKSDCYFSPQSGVADQPFFDALDRTFDRALLYKGVDEKGEIRQHPTAMAEAYDLGKKIVEKNSE